MENIENQIKEIDNEIKEELRENSEYSAIAMSIPGVGPVAAFTFLAYLGDCSQFPKASNTCAYAGLSPRVDSLGGVTRIGSIRPGCKPIRKIIMQTAWTLIRCDQEGPLGLFYKRLHERVGKKKAAVATARKIIETFHYMIRNKVTYYGSDYEMLSTKMKRILSVQL